MQIKEVLQPVSCIPPCNKLLVQVSLLWATGWQGHTKRLCMREIHMPPWEEAGTHFEFLVHTWCHDSKEHTFLHGTWVWEIKIIRCLCKYFNSFMFYYSFLMFTYPKFSCVTLASGKGKRPGFVGPFQRKSL